MSQPGGMMSGPTAGKGGPPGGGTGGFVGGPKGGPDAGGMGANFMSNQGKGGPQQGMGTGGFMGNSMQGGKGGNQQGGFMQAGAGGPAAGQGGFMADPYGQNLGGGQYSAMGSQMQNMNNQTGITAIEKRVEWRLCFFAGACCVFMAGLISIFHFVISFGDVSHWSPCTFLSCCFLLIFGIMMIALDLPTATNNKQVLQLRDNIYTFALFLTRFTGRGMWYVFLGTHCWVALYDDSINQFIGITFTLYLVLLGMAAAAKGIMVSKKLHDVKKMMQDKQVPPTNFMSQGGMFMNKAEFKMMLDHATDNQIQFTDAEFDYVMNALNFKPRHDGQVTLEEIDVWLQHDKGYPMLLV